MSPTTEVQPVSNAFARLLSEFRQGASLSELTNAMQTSVANARETGKCAELKYSLRFTPKGNALIIEDMVSTKLAKPERDQAIFFATEQNTLQRDNPQQAQLPFREVQRAPQTVKEIVLPKAAAQ